MIRNHRKLKSRPGHKSPDKVAMVFDTTGSLTLVRIGSTNWQSAGRFA